MAHAAQNPEENGNLRRMKKGEPFDPDELSRLLTIHLDKQKLKSKQRRAARAANAAAALNPFVPKVAATAFERTTTPDAIRQVHNLSIPAVKQHSEVLQVDIPSLRRNQALDQAVMERNLLRNRNQWQWTQDMREAAAVDVDRDVYRPPQRTFAELAHLMNKGQDEWPLSNGGFVFWEDGPSPTVKAKPKYAFDGRNDWAQRDFDGGKQKILEKASPMRKRDSIWILRSKKDNSMGKERDNVVTGMGSCGSSPDGDRNRSGRRGFLPTVFHRLRSY